MSIIRVEHNNNYTTICNYHLRDKSISLKAKGLLTYMLSLPEDWDYSISGLAKICKEGPDSIRSAISELEEHGYMTRERSRNEDGTLGGSEYIVREIPNKINPTKEIPMLENPTQDNQTQIITNITNNNELKKSLNKKNTNSHTMQTNCVKIRADYKPEWFERFIKAYPRGEKIKEAMDAWDELRPSRELCDIMAVAIKKQLRSKQWQDKKYIPCADRWIREQRWMDKVEEVDISDDIFM